MYRQKRMDNIFLYSLGNDRRMTTGCTKRVFSIMLPTSLPPSFPVVKLE